MFIATIVVSININWTLHVRAEWKKKSLNKTQRPNGLVFVDGVSVWQHFIIYLLFYLKNFLICFYSPFSFVTVYDTFWNLMFSGCNFKSIVRCVIGLLESVRCFKVQSLEWWPNKICTHDDFKKHLNAIKENDKKKTFKIM